MIPARIALLLLCGGVSFQALADAPGDHPYFPMAVGNYWIYQFHETPAGGSESSGHHSMEVVGDTILGGEAYWLVSMTRSEFGSNDVSHATCGVRVTEPPEETVELVFLGGSEALCNIFGTTNTATPSLAATPWGDLDYWISGLQYRITPIRYGATAGGLRHEWINFAEGIGFVATRHVTGRLWVHVVYAKIGNSSYGQHPDDVEWQSLSPRGVGDEWLWRYERSSINFPNEDYYVHSTVLDDLGNGTYVMQHTIYSLRFRIEDVVECTVYRSESGREIATGPDLCRTSPITWTMSGPLRLTGTLAKRDWPDLRLSVRPSLDLGWIYGNVSGGAEWGEDGNVSTWIEDVGLVKWRAWNTHGTAGSHVYTSLTLEGAVVGGVEYGSMPSAVRRSHLAASCNASDERASMDVYPNPARERVMVNVENPSGWNLSVHVFDLTGRERLFFTHEATSSSTTFPIELGGLGAGLYIVRILAAGDWCETATVAIID